MADPTWCKLYHAFMDHPKVLKAGPNAAYLWVVSIAWASRNLTDGFIPSEQVGRLVVWDDVIEVRRKPRRKGEHWFVEARRLAERLVETGLWEQAQDGYQIHDFLHWQRSAKEVEALQQTRSESGKRGGIASGVARRSKQTKQTVKQTRSKNEADTETYTYLTPLSPPSKTKKPRTKRKRAEPVAPDDSYAAQIRSRMERTKKDWEERTGEPYPGEHG